MTVLVIVTLAVSKVGTYILYFKGLKKGPKENDTNNTLNNDKI